MYFIVIFLIIIVYLILEKVLHERRIGLIPVRIHVNGVRGKSSVTRLIASALRKANIPTLAKVTGEIPTLIYPDGHEEAILRRGPVRIQEQVRFFKKAARMNVRAAVVECMALAPPLQMVSEIDMIKSTIGVITNVRPDHFEVMGRTLDDVAEALSFGIPKFGTLVTGDPRFFHFFQAKAKQMNTKTILAEDGACDVQKNDGKTALHAENLTIARKVWELLGIELAVNHDGLSDGAIRKNDSHIIRLETGGKIIYFVDAFRANDIESTRIIQEYLLSENNCPPPFVALLNNRSDRPLRMLSFSSFLSRATIYDYVMLIGDHQWKAKACIQRRKTKDTVITLKSRSPRELLDEICCILSYSKFTLVGMGNYKGMGSDLCRFAEDREKQCY
jgi:poly-gamma-glutamate synthase PgsB/CapB